MKASLKNLREAVSNVFVFWRVSQIAGLTCVLFGFSPAAHGALIVHYNFESTGPPYSDQAGTANNLAQFSPTTNPDRVSGGATFSGSVLDFERNDSDRLTTPNTPELQMGSLTVATRVKLESIDEKRAIITKENGTGASWGLEAFHNPMNGFNRFNFFIFNTDGQALGIGTSLQPPIVGETYHVVATYDAVSGLPKLYVNGVQNQFTFPAALVNKVITYSNPGPLSIGTSNAALPSFDGMIDDVRLYNEALNDQQIASIAGHDTTITADATASFGRVMLGQTPTLTGPALTKTGVNATGFTSTVTGGNANGITATTPGSGILGTGAQSANVGLQLNNNNNGSATTGSKSFSLVTDNLAVDSLAAGQGSTDTDDTTTITATVVDNRTITATPVNLGNVIVGQTTGVQISTLSTTGDNDNFTAVAVNATSASNGGASAATGTTTLFNSDSSTTTRSVTGLFGTAGAQSGSIPLSVTGEGLTGEAVNGVSIGFTAQAFNSAQAYSGNIDNPNEIIINLGQFTQGQSGAVSSAFELYNLIVNSSQTANLDVLGTFDFDSGDAEIDLTFLESLTGTVAGGPAGNVDFSALVDTTAAGVFSSSFTIDLSDDQSIQGAQEHLFTLTFNAEVVPVPEPGTLAMLMMAALVFPLFTRRRAR